MLYAAYGSHLYQNQRANHLPSAKFVGTAVLKDTRLVFRKARRFYWITFEECPGESAPCAIYDISDKDKVDLDHYEGVRYPDECYFPHTIDLEVTKADGTVALEKDILIYKLPESSPEGKPRALYFGKCLAGYLEHGFETEPLQKAYLRIVDMDQEDE